jgi:hypothetical protein
MKKLLKVYLTVTKYVLQKKTGKKHSIILMNLYKKMWYQFKNHEYMYIRFMLVIEDPTVTEK